MEEEAVTTAEVADTTRTSGTSRISTSLKAISNDIRIRITEITIIREATVEVVVVVVMAVVATKEAAEVVEAAAAEDTRQRRI